MKKILPGLALATLFGTSAAMAASYEVTITNVTHGTVFTPILVVSHDPGVKLFELGQPASDELAALAEGGDTSLLAAKLETDSRVVDTADSGGPLLPGESVTVTVEAPHGKGQVSVASMLLPTNDGFIALNGVNGPKKRKHPVTYSSPGYDAGSEPNDELCDNIPGGGACGGTGGSPGVGGEDYVHVHSGIHGIGDLIPSDSDWGNPAAYITIMRVK